MNKNVRDYSSNYNIKDFIQKEIAPKFFDLDDVNQLNIGLIGYSTEIIANTTEDTANAISTYAKEMFPNRATIPESIYTYASLFQVDDLMASPAKLQILLFINEDDINNLGEIKGNYKEFVLDSQLVINVEDKQFMMDYDIRITSKPHRGDYIFNASYIKSFTNTLSDINNPYIKIRRINYDGSKYLGLLLTVRQVNKFTYTENLISNEKINLPSIVFSFTEQLAGFEVFYKEPGSNESVQLKKRLSSSTPIKEPFCYYRFKNEESVELTFSTRDGYFQPKYNSEILIKYFTTTGEEGNFPLYKGNNVVASPSSDMYEYNNNLILLPFIQSESIGGKKSLTLEEIRNIVIERYSTVNSYTTENDLQLFFNTLKYKFGNDIFFVKKRDDIFERLFSAFSLIKDQYRDIMHTNTLHCDFIPENFDIEYEQSNRLIMKPGRIFRYHGNSLDTCKPSTKSETIVNVTTPKAGEFVFTNPFLISVSKNPTVVGFYLNSINKRHSLEYTYVNNESNIQFMCNNIIVERNALYGESSYKMTALLTPTSELEQELVNADGVFNGNLKLKMLLDDGTGSASCYRYMDFVSYDSKTNIYEFVSYIETDDYMTPNEKFKVTNFHDIDTNEVGVHLIPIMDAVVSVQVEYKFIGEEKNAFIHTNTYDTSIDKINFITPINIMRSRVKYIDLGNSKYSMFVDFIPFVSAMALKDKNSYATFLENITLQYMYMSDVMGMITNNYSIDLKFYNTYGRSKNFSVGENGAKLDQVNISLKIQIKPTIGADVEELKTNVRLYIKSFIEKINDSGGNGVYMSNLIQALENDFPEILYMKFVSINNYDSSVQVLENKMVNEAILTKEERKNYVPEHLVIKEEDIIIDIL